jgi:hypothetical protein
VYTFQAVNTTGALSGVVIVKAKVEGYYTIAQSSNGDLYSWGAITDRNGTNTVIGDGTSVYHELPTLLSASLFGNKTVIDFDVSQYNAMVLTNDGTVYSIGDGTYFLTGTGNDTFQPVYSANAQLSSALITGEVVTRVHPPLFKYQWQYKHVDKQILTWRVLEQVHHLLVRSQTVQVQ